MISGNEEVDAFAKSALFLSQHNFPLPLRNCKSLIKIKFKYIRKLRYNNITAGKTWECLLQDKNRISLVTKKDRRRLFCMLMDHDYLQQLLNKICVTTSASCLLSGRFYKCMALIKGCYSKLKDVYTGNASVLLLLLDSKTAYAD
ncbi:hypothetical protein CDAR_465681 [Caerostris darwini]|uniref:Uncharacterized protein n=1 Tax=Caerostris darwini TaxID=1538125 RepID=A0AAV4MK62_9ARAC|nr:hypothetical protein CDAR_465681 [Caerostris darwini]